MDYMANVLITLLQETFSGFAFSYDVEDDVVSYWKDGHKNRRIGVRDAACNASGITREHEHVRKAFLEACNGVSGSISVMARHDGDEERYRVAWISENGKVRGLVVPEKDEDDFDSPDGSSLTAIQDEDALSERIDDDLEKLATGEKGILFEVMIDGFSNMERSFGRRKMDNYMHAVMNALMTDFRLQDVICRISEDRFIVFMCGMLTVDIIERRAQRIIEIFMQENNGRIGRQPLSCRMGVAVGNRKSMYVELLKQAEKAIKHSNSGRYSFYDDIKCRDDKMILKM